MGVHVSSELGNLVYIDGIMNHSIYLNILRHHNLKLSAQLSPKIWVLETTLFFMMITILSIRLSTFVCGISIIAHKF